MAEKLTCMLVDDDAEDRTIFCYSLEEADKNSTCLTARNGVEALDKLSTPEVIPDYIFLDLNMPLMGGKECLAEMNKLQHLQHVPVIIYSTSDHQRDIEETKQLGAAHFLTKPYNPDNLTMILKSLFKKEPLPFFIKEK